MYFFKCIHQLAILYFKSKIYENCYKHIYTYDNKYKWVYIAIIQILIISFLNFNSLRIVSQIILFFYIIYFFLFLIADWNGLLFFIIYRYLIIIKYS